MGCSEFKRIGIYVLFLVVVYAVYQDLMAPPASDLSNYSTQIEQKTYQIKQVKVQPGDTLLSIMERLHPNATQLKMEQVIHDFSLLNPNTDPSHLKEGTFYYFPYYKQKED